MLNYRLIINDKNNPLLYVFIGGFSADLNVWNKIVLTKKASINNILLIDNLGAGESPQPDKPYTTKLMAETIKTIIDSLKFQTFTLIGHSLGGAICQKLAIEKINVSKLVLLSTFAKIDLICKHFLEARVKSFSMKCDRKLIAESSLPTLFSNNFLNNKDNVEFAVQRFMTNKQTLQGMQGQLAACINHDSTQILPDIKTDTYVITGEKDVLVDPEHSEKLHKLLPNSELLHIADCGHMLPIESPEVLSTMIFSD